MHIITHLTDRQIEILAFLMDDQGHPLWDVSKTLGYDEGYLSKKIKAMKDMRLVYHIQEKSSRCKTRSPNMAENRLFINKEYDILNGIRSEVTKRIEYHRPRAVVYRLDGIHMELETAPHQTLLNKFESFSRWLDATIQEARNYRHSRLAPRPMSLADQQALLFDYGSFLP